jgi:serine/threonine protein phosphatase PrpC
LKQKQGRSLFLDSSGSTCVSVLISGNRLFCANVGDSRAILVSKEQHNSGPSFTALSRDHKPEDLEEAQRIIMNNGRIDQINEHKSRFSEKQAPLRVWMKNEDKPGLAMTRSFGDTIAAKVGVICDPEVKEFTLHNNDMVLVLASDGVWEFLSNREVAQMVYPFYAKRDADGAAEKVVSRAFLRWKEEGISSDDITCLVVFLDVQTP